MEFIVYLRINEYDGGEVCVEESVTREEIEFLKQCYLDEVSISDCDELADLYERLSKLAAEENQDIIEDLMDEDDEEIDYDECDYIVYIPDEIKEMVNAEED